VDYSIVIPVFNKAELTRNCLAKLRPSLEGAGEGEVIVIDNASTDHTQAVLAEFPWIRMIHNDRNLGFSGANNQGAREARGRMLVLLNNDTEPISKWLAPMLAQLADPGVGAVGARLLFADQRIQHAGVIVRPSLMGAAGFVPYHYLFRSPKEDPESLRRREFQIVTGACLATPRDLYLELGGLDEGYWNGYEDVDYCLKVGERGLRVVYEPEALLFHYESQSGTQRFRKTQANVQRLSERWRGRVRMDASRVYVDAGLTVGLTRARNGGLGTYTLRTMPVDVVVHGVTGDLDRPAFEASLGTNRTPLGRVAWPAPGTEIETVRSMMAVRGERQLAIVRSDAKLEPGWLDELLARVTGLSNAAAATFSDGIVNGSHVPLLATDARCVLLRLRSIPQHLELRPFDTLDGAVADLLLRCVDLQRGTIGAFAHAALGAPVSDESFEREHGMTIQSVANRDPVAIERRLQQRPPFNRGLVSIVMLSWNAPEYTTKALESIRAHTAEPYEVIIVDNGSKPETLAVLRTMDDPHVRIVYNKENRGFSGGNNDGIAHAGGEYVIILNNDVIVTPHWAEDLVDAFRRIPGLGISAPRSNRVVGDQQLPDATYSTEEQMFAYAADRRRAFSQRGYLTDRAIGFCWCIHRTVLDTIGALDERYDLGNFEDDDYCMRVRAAGYWIYVCDDVFIHHFGSRSFAANNVDYRATMEANWEKFANKWGFTGPLSEQGYQGRAVHDRGFDSSRHYIPFPPAQPRPIAVTLPPAKPAEDANIVFAIAVREEADWSAAAQFVKRFVTAFRAGDPVRLAIAAFGQPDALVIASRVEKIAEKAGSSGPQCADIDIADFENDAAWEIEKSPAWIDVCAVKDRSPSALRRLAAERSA
jgi:GT2 family glycosyltransferase